MPEKFIPSPAILTLLRAIYPTVRWEEVDFYKGLPWYISPKMANALVLPAAYSHKRIHIYYQNWHTNTCRGLSTIVHESFHVLQFQNLQSIGISLLRNFLVIYFAHFIPSFLSQLFQKRNFSAAREKAYYQHPMEIPAYAQDEAFRSACFEFGLSKMYGENTITDELIHEFVANNLQLIQYQSGATYPKNPLWYAFSFILLLKLSIIKPLGDLGNFILGKIRKSKH